MNGEELHSYIVKDCITKAVTWGVFARNELPQGTLLPGAYVVNSHEAPGQHWFLLYVGETVELYDSLGKSPRDYNLKMNCVYSTDKIQPVYSVSCGLYVLYFLFWRSRGIPMNVLFDSLRENGEEIVKNHFSHLKLL